MFPDFGEQPETGDSPVPDAEDDEAEADDDEAEADDDEDEDDESGRRRSRRRGARTSSGGKRERGEDGKDEDPQKSASRAFQGTNESNGFKDPQPPSMQGHPPNP